MTSRKNTPTADDEEPKVAAELPYPFEKEITAKQNQRIHIVDKFIANKRVAPVEGKFYSKADEASVKDFAQRQHFWKAAEERRSGSRIAREFPVLESQKYGWMPETVSETSVRRVNYIQRMKPRCFMTTHDEKLSSERVTERPKFTGIRFHLS